MISNFSKTDKDWLIAKLDINSSLYYNYSIWCKKEDYTILSINKYVRKEDLIYSHLNWTIKRVRIAIGYKIYGIKWNIEFFYPSPFSEFPS